MSHILLIIFCYLLHLYGMHLSPVWYLSVFGQQSRSTLVKKTLFTFLKEKPNPQMTGFSVIGRTNFAF